MKKIGILLIVILIQGCATTAPPPETPAASPGVNQVIIEAMQRWDDPYEGIILYTKAIEIDTTSALAYFLRGELYFKTGEPAKAASDFTEALTLDSSFTAAYLARGEIRLWHLDDPEGKEDFLTAYQNAPDNLTAALNYLEIIQHDEKEKAEKIYRELENRFPENYILFMKKAIWNRDLDEFNRALENLDKAVSLAPSESGLYLIRGDIYHWLGRPAEALENYTKAIEIQPEEAYAYLKRGLLFLETERYDEARRDADFIKNREEHIHESLLLEILLDIEEGRYNNAANTLAHLNEHRTEDIPLPFYEGLIYYFKGEADRVKKALQSYMTDEPDNPSGYLGWWLIMTLEEADSETPGSYENFREKAINWNGSVANFFKYNGGSLKSVLILIFNKYPELKNSLPEEMKKIIGE